MDLILPAPTSDISNAASQLDRLAASRLNVFDPAVIRFLAAFAERILSDRSLRAAPELVALAYWFRPAAIAALKTRHTALGQHGLLRPRGIAFHIAPANVDSIFVYSWFLSLLCGNRNIVRISHRDSPHRSSLIGILAGLLAEPEHQTVCDATAVLSYARDDALTAQLSERCHLRIVWGGDATVRHIRRIPLPPLATEIVFPNRISWALLAAEQVLAADAASLAQLAGAFYNDAFWFAQQACSSPRAMLWIGPPEQVSTARERFWQAITAELARRGETADASQLAARLVAAHNAAAELPLQLETRLHDWPLRLASDSFSDAMRAGHCGYGLFYELQRADLAASAELFHAEDQTLAYWGFARDTLAAWSASLPDRALDRIVPIGQALRFADRWDGHDLMLAFSRLIVIE